MRALGYRLYFLSTAGAVALIGLVCAVFAACLEPSDGDLTRLGGYAEHEYGWRGEQLRFDPPLVPAARLGQSYDVVVVGDSFSIPVEAVGEPRPGDKTHWTDFFKARTGLSVASFNRDRVPLDDYLASDGFLNAPPRLLVIEQAERTLHWVRQEDGRPCMGLPPPRTVAIPLVPVSPQPQPRPQERDQSHWLNTGRTDTAIDHLVKNIPRWVAGLNLSPVSRHALSRDGLFSSRRSSELLVFKDDFAKAALTDDFLRSLSCHFLNVQRRVEANGVTKFVLMIAPDRTTAYADYLPGLRLPNLTEFLAGTKGLSVLRLDRAMQAAVRSGVQDVYLPADTHWASAGMTIAAEALIEALGK